jgi:hypothetical protein
MAEPEVEEYPDPPAVTVILPRGLCVVEYVFAMLSILYSYMTVVKKKGT